jgi:omega-amidase
MISEHLIIQNQPGQDKLVNLKKVRFLIDSNYKSSVNFIILPECFNCPYGTVYFKDYAEELAITPKNPTVQMLHEISIDYPSVYIIGGTIPEKDKDKYYNTCTIWINGKIIDTYRKIHLFDINIPDKVNFKESDVLSPGTKPTIVETPYGNIGIGICFDLRFNNLSNYYADKNCHIIVYPGSFTQYTGQLHWELLLRARAVDSQCWVIGVSTALNLELDYHSYGHSMVVEPWGKVTSLDISDQEAVFIEKINIDLCKYFQNNVPIKANKKIIKI